MQINRRNYEIWFLDYYENKLTPEEVAGLMIFLEDNPDLKADFESFENFAIEPDPTVLFESKKKLAKPEYKPTGNIDPWNYERKMVASLEGDLSLRELKELKEFMALNPQAKLEYNLLKKTFLDAPIIEFPERDLLKKKGLFVLYRTHFLWTVSSAAAAILLLFGLYSILYNSAHSPNPVVDNLPPAKAIEINRLDVEQGPVSNPASKDFANLTSYHSRLHETVSVMQKLQPLPPLAALNSKNLLIPGQESTVFFTITYENDFEGYYTSAHYDNKSKQRSFVARFVSGFVNKVVGDPNPDNKSLIEFTVEGYNLISDRQVEVEKQLDKNGNVVAYDVRGETIAFSHKINNE